MEELFNNILYLIPIALFIAIRLINAKGNQSGKEQEKDSEGLGDLLKKIREAQENPAYGRALTEDRGVYIPPRTPAKQPEQKKKAQKKASPPPKQSALQPATLDTAPLASASAKNAPAVQASGLRGIRPGWTPLQQAVVWSEILGAPKGA